MKNIHIYNAVYFKKLRENYSQHPFLYKLSTSPLTFSTCYANIITRTVARARGDCSLGVGMETVARVNPGDYFFLCVRHKLTIATTNIQNVSNSMYVIMATTSFRRNSSALAAGRFPFRHLLSYKIGNISSTVF